MYLAILFRRNFVKFNLCTSVILIYVSGHAGVQCRQNMKTFEQQLPPHTHAACKNTFTVDLTLIPAIPFVERFGSRSPTPPPPSRSTIWLQVVYHALPVYIPKFCVFWPNFEKKVAFFPSFSQIYAEFTCRALSSPSLSDIFA